MDARPLNEVSRPLELVRQWVDDASRIVALNFVYAVLGVILMFVSYRVIDWLTPAVDFPAELKKGNIAVAIFIAAIFLAIAMIIGGALS